MKKYHVLLKADLTPYETCTFLDNARLCADELAAKQPGCTVLILEEVAEMVKPTPEPKCPVRRIDGEFVENGSGWCMSRQDSIARCAIDAIANRWINVVDRGQCLPVEYAVSSAVSGGPGLYKTIEEAVAAVWPSVFGEEAKP